MSRTFPEPCLYTRDESRVLFKPTNFVPVELEVHLAQMVLGSQPNGVPLRP